MLLLIVSIEVSPSSRESSTFSIFNKPIHFDERSLSTYFTFSWLSTEWWDFLGDVFILFQFLKLLWEAGAGEVRERVSLHRYRVPGGQRQGCYPQD